MRVRVMIVVAVGALLGVWACGQTTPPKCTAQNCIGCCTGAGDCLGGVTFFECGSGAEICATCELGQVCSHGSCITAPPDAGCGLSSCGGCCDSSNVCRSGIEDHFCGSHAGVCIDCLDAGLGCDMHSCA